MPAVKHMKLDLGVQPEKSAPSSIVVESGPVEYAAAEGVPDAVEGAGEIGGEYYEEEPTLKSAAQLMGHGGKVKPSIEKKPKINQTLAERSNEEFQKSITLNWISVQQPTISLCIFIISHLAL